MGKETTRDEKVFRDYPVRRAVAVMAIPTIIGQLIVLFYNLADTYFIGRTGDPCMVAAASLILPVFNISGALSTVIGLGGSTLISRLLGVNKRDEASRVSSFTFYCALLIGLIWSAGVFVFMTPLLNALGADADTLMLARQYAFCVVVLGGIPTLLQMTSAQLLRSVGYSKQAGFGMSMGGILNIVLDPIFMFLILPKGYEIIGAGIATLLSNIVTLLYFLMVIRSLKTKTVLSLNPHDAKPKSDSIKSIFINGLPGGISNFLFDFSQIMINRLMSGYGAIPLASIGIVLKAERIPLNTGMGICQGIIPIIAYNYSAKNTKRMRETVRFSRLCGLVVAAVSIALYEVFSPYVMRLFIDNVETVELGAKFLQVRCLATPFMFMAFHTLFSIQAMGEGKIAMWLAIIRQLVLYVPILILMNHIFGMYGLVWAQIIGDVMTDIVSLIWFESRMRKIENSVEVPA